MRKVEYFRWWIEIDGKRRLSRVAMTREDAGARYPTSTPDEDTREVREEPGRGEGVKSRKKPR